MAWLWWGLAAVWLAGAFRTRKRAAAIPVLAPSEAPAGDEYAFLLGRGVELAAAAPRAAAAHARALDLDSLDLIAEDLPSLPALDVVETTDAEADLDDRMRPGRTAACALLVRTSLLDRAGVAPGGDRSPAQMTSEAARLKRYARRAGVAVAPGLLAPREGLGDDRAWFDGRFGRAAGVALAVRSALWLLALAGPFVAPAAGTVSLAAYSLALPLGLAGGPIRPRDLVLASLLRLPFEGWRLARLFAGRNRRAEREQAEALRPAYDELLSGGLEPFFKPRREDCPLCGSRELSRELRTVDLYQAKPGRFTLDRCGGCGTVFQNPRLSSRGLDFYYRDSYDGLGARLADVMFASDLTVYLERAKLVEGLIEPRRWLDVGAGHGYFCCAAQQVFPRTQMDALDLGESVEEAARADWAHSGRQGLLPEVAPSIAGRYDVISLFHCIEHVEDVRRELAAARTALRPGGLLVIEAPEPDCPLRRVLGRYWFIWFQPQHLHLLPLRTMIAEIERAGFEIVPQRTGGHRMPVDFVTAALLLLNRLAPRPDLPWRRRRAGAGLWRAATFTLGAPLLIAGRLLDRTAGAWARSRGLGDNAFQVVARRRP